MNYLEIIRSKTKEELKEIRERLKKKEKQRTKKERKTYRLLNNKLSKFCIIPYPPNPDDIKIQEIKNKYLYNTWIIERSPNSGTLRFEISFKSLEEMYEFNLFFLEKDYRIKEQSNINNKFKRNENGRGIHIKKLQFDFYEDLIYFISGNNLWIEMNILKKNFDIFWRDLIQFCKEKNYIFPVLEKPLFHKHLENISTDWWITQGILKEN